MIGDRSSVGSGGVREGLIWVDPGASAVILSGGMGPDVHVVDLIEMKMKIDVEPDGRANVGSRRQFAGSSQVGERHRPGIAHLTFGHSARRPVLPEPTMSRTQYWRLFAVIGVASGFGDGASTFNLPDLRGTFLRGMDGTAGVDPDRAARIAAKPGGNTGDALGSLQLDDFKSHSHGNGSFNRLLRSSSGPTTALGADFTSNEPDILNSAPMLNAGGSETRPRNIYVNYIIKK